MHFTTRQLARRAGGFLRCTPEDGGSVYGDRALVLGNLPRWLEWQAVSDDDNVTQPEFATNLEENVTLRPILLVSSTMATFSIDQKLLNRGMMPRSWKR